MMMSGGVVATFSVARLSSISRWRPIMNKSYPMQTTVDGDGSPALGSVLPFPKEGEGEPKMDEFPMQTTIEGEEDSPLGMRFLM